MTRRDYARDNERTRLRREFYDEERSAVGICTKYTLFFENFLFLIAGIGMTTLGTYILVLKDKKLYDAIDFFLDPACIMCLVGAIVTVVCLLGSYGALRENTCCLKLYYIIVSVTLLAELTCSVLLFVSYYVPDVKNFVFPTDTFRQAIVHYRDDPDMQHLIDTMQSDLECCGTSNDNKGFMEWNNNIYFNCSRDNQSPEKCSVPYSCCVRKAGDKINYRCGFDVFQTASDGSIEPNEANAYRINKDGCIKALGDWINSNVLIVGGIMLGILLPQVLVVALTKNLINMINTQKSKW